MTPNLTALAETLGLPAELVPLVLAGLLTGPVFLTQSIPQWFDERNP